ncbi:hypothetical protein [Brevundimonas sp.]|uniref:hypothetical protein n=1 Tax=Brevundimonas sp. TaxID=1871086 RepID=UPI00121BCE5B|nr:hypothetical protein [Brevundimonas sp.]TAJ56883.1 MAG: hypothetical protein EPO49_13535 [Brevundimonas sp.]
MTYFCFIESTILSVPHMEPLLAETEDEAMLEAADLMGLHSSAIAAHVFRDEDRVGTVTPDDISIAPSQRFSRTRPSGDTPAA